MNRMRRAEARKQINPTPCDSCKFACKDPYYCNKWAKWFRKRWPIVCGPFRERVERHE